MSLLVPDSGLLFWMLLSFSIVLIVLVRYGFPTILKAAERRQSYINQSLEDAKQAELRLASVDEDAKAIISSAQKERALLLSDAEQMVNKIISSAKDAAKEEAQQIVGRASIEAETLKQRAISDAADQIVGLSVKIAEKVIAEKLSDDESQMQLIDRLLKEEIQAKA